MKKTACWVIAPAFFAVCSIPQKKTIGDKPETNATPETHLMKSVGDQSPALYMSADFGLSWAPVGGNLPADANVYGVEQLGDQIVVATENYGLFIGRPEHADWIPIGLYLPGPKITALHISGDELYAGVYEKGLFVSKDSGHTWASLNQMLPDLSVRSILRVEGAVLVGTNSGLFRKADGEKRWAKVFDEGQIIALSAKDGKIAGGTNFGMILSTDSGRHWNWIEKVGAVHNFAILDKCLVVLDISGDIRLTEDWGKSWNLPRYYPRQYSYGYDVAQVGDYWLLSNNYGIHRSEDKGKHWEHLVLQEDFVFYDFAVRDQVIYAGMRAWKERRPKIGNR